MYIVYKIKLRTVDVEMCSCASDWSVGRCAIRVCVHTSVM